MDLNSYDQDIANITTPGRKAINRILIGSILTTTTVGFMYLQFILPIIGLLLMLLGYRYLQSENKWFRYCYFITILRMLVVFPILILYATIIQSIVDLDYILKGLTGCIILLTIVQYVCMWMGFRNVQAKAEVPVRAYGCIALSIWYVLIVFMAQVQYEGWLIGMIFLIAYICIIRSMYRISKELDEVGYDIEPSRVHISNKLLTISVMLIFLIGISCCYLFGGSYPMKWSIVKSEDQTDLQQAKAHLLNLGFPSDILEDLTKEDILACKDARQVIVDYPDKLSVGPTSNPSDFDAMTTQNDENDIDKLQMTGIGVKLSERGQKWKLFHHFYWTFDNNFHGTEAIQLWPASLEDDYIEISGDVTGQVLYDKGKQTYKAPYYSLGTEDYVSNDFIFGQQNCSDVFATFSFPKNSKAQRGYLSYSIENSEEDVFISSWFNYTHQNSWAQYPVITAKEYIMIGFWGDEGAFTTIQEALQFESTKYGVDMDY